MDERGRVALLVPTYRNSPQILANLTYLAALSSQDTRVFISDSSCDATKRQHVVGLQEAYPFCAVSIRSQRTPLYQDVVALLEIAKSYPYVAICADDDYMSLDYLLRSVDVLERDRAAVCSAGNYLLWLSNGTVQLASRESTEASPVARLQKSFDPGLFNTFFFAVFRRSAMTPWLNFCKGHPMIGPFFDFIHYWSLLAQGTVRCHQKGFYLWTGENWDTPDINLRSRARYYTDIGLPEDFALFHDLHFAVEGLHFFLGEHSPILDPNTRVACAQAVWSRCMSRFCEGVHLYRAKYLDLVRHSPQSLQALDFLIQPNNGSPGIFIDRFVTIIARFSKQRAKRYAAHIQASLSRANMFMGSGLLKAEHLTIR
jgi:Glycosyl transferase family 2